MKRIKIGIVLLLCIGILIVLFSFFVSDIFYALLIATTGIFCILNATTFGKMDKQNEKIVREYENSEEKMKEILAEKNVKINPKKSFFIQAMHYFSKRGKDEPQI